jgi:hypothetical protein
MVLKHGVIRYKERRRRRDKEFGFFGREKWEELEVIAVENHRFYFDIAHILSVVLGIFFSTKHGIAL